MYIVLADLKRQVENKTRENQRIHDQLKSREFAFSKVVNEGNSYIGKLNEAVSFNQVQHSQAQAMQMQINDLSTKNNELLDCIEEQVV